MTNTTTAPVVSDETIIAYAKARGFTRDITVARNTGLYDFVRVSGWTASTHCSSFMDLKAETFAPAPAPLVVNGRAFTVTAEPHDREGIRYTLTGARGARYQTMRRAKQLEVMFLVDARGFGMAMGKTPTWLTDANGSLEVVR